MAEPHYRRGFTLIELLVVISIIALLSSVTLASLNTARAKARDTQRVASVRQIVAALELYRDKNGAYPACTAAIGGDAWCGNCTAASGVTEFTTALAPLITDGFLSSIPVDPLSTGPCYMFEYFTNNQTTANSCGGVVVTSYPYVLRFGTELITNLGMPQFSSQRVTGREYCVFGS